MSERFADFRPQTSQKKQSLSGHWTWAGKLCKLGRSAQAPRFPLECYFAVSNATLHVDETCFELRMVTGTPSIGEFSTILFLPRSRAKTLPTSQVRFFPSRLKEIIVLKAPP